MRIVVLKRLYNLSDEQMEYQVLARMSYQRFCGLGQARNIPDRTTFGPSRAGSEKLAKRRQKDVEAS